VESRRWKGEGRREKGERENGKGEGKRQGLKNSSENLTQI
jgi:hypothetical protein